MHLSSRFFERAVVAFLLLNPAFANIGQYPNANNLDDKALILRPHDVSQDLREEWPEWCTRLDRRIGSWSNHMTMVKYIAVGSGVTAMGVCGMLSSLDQEGAVRCSYVSMMVAGALSGLYFVVFTTYAATYAPRRTVDGEARNMIQELATRCTNIGWTFDSITITHPGSHERRDSAVPFIKTLITFKNVSMPNMNGTVDYEYADYGSGRGQIKMQPRLRQTLINTPNGAGFKIPYIVRNSILVGDAEAQAAGEGFAKDWHEKVLTENISQYSGEDKTGNSMNFIFRIIPEIRGYGKEYEDVKIPWCPRERDELRRD